MQDTDRKPSPPQDKAQASADPVARWEGVPRQSGCGGLRRPCGQAIRGRPQNALTGKGGSIMRIVQRLGQLGVLWV